MLRAQADFPPGVDSCAHRKPFDLETMTWSVLQIVAKASKSLAKDKPLGVGELNLVH